MLTEKLNLQDPLQGRKWLQLLKTDPECGFLLKPNLNVPKGYMGFSLNSNELGLRGPADRNASNIIFGTSFAMGIAVDNGKNWWEIVPLSADWLNLGLAVGIGEWEKLLARYSFGSKGKAVLLYHPNLWVHCLMYEKWRSSQKDVFTALRWRRNLPGCLHLVLKRMLQRRTMLRTGRIVQFTHDGDHFEIDTRYCYINIDQHKNTIDRGLHILTQMLGQFQEVILIRVPIKNELLPADKYNQIGLEVIKSYELLWNATKQRLGCLKNCRATTWRDVTLKHFHPIDSHWNSDGNKSFAEFIRTYCS